MSDPRVDEITSTLLPRCSSFVSVLILAVYRRLQLESVVRIGCRPCGLRRPRPPLALMPPGHPLPARNVIDDKIQPKLRSQCGTGPVACFHGRRFGDAGTLQRLHDHRLIVFGETDRLQLLLQMTRHPFICHVSVTNQADNSVDGGEFVFGDDDPTGSNAEISHH